MLKVKISDIKLIAFFLQVHWKGKSEKVALIVKKPGQMN